MKIAPACLIAALLVLAGPLAAADATPTPAPLPDTGAAMIRVVGALLLVFALLFGGLWLMKNWQRLAMRRGRMPKLRLLEAQSLGGRQGVYVVAYEQQRFLVAASPSGVSLLSHLPELDAAATQNESAPAPMSFFQALQSVTARPS
ncbi:MAG TPA: hypothetical protein DCY13_07220 [Verrucomicrobiales bacterium]|nr:hypothetical protein [Verrucomicrobiales bacterium]